MRKITTMAVLSMVMLALTATMAFAAVKYGTNGADNLTGTAYGDALYGYGGDDRISGGDLISGGAGNDQIGDPGPGAFDKIYCGAGTDFVEASRIDYVAPDCEKVNCY